MKLLLIAILALRPMASDLKDSFKLVKDFDRLRLEMITLVESNTEQQRWRPMIEEMEQIYLKAKTTNIYDSLLWGMETTIEGFLQYCMMCLSDSDYLWAEKKLLEFDCPLEDHLNHFRAKLTLQGMRQVIKDMDTPDLESLQEEVKRLDFDIDKQKALRAIDSAA